MNKPTNHARAGHDARIILGDGWRQFAFKADGLEYLGTIQRGMEIGALAQDEAGSYLQVNGDIQQALNKSRVAMLLRNATVRRQAVVPAHQPVQAHSERPAVSVTIKRRRRVVLPAT
jgi:hypothetical protein